MQGIPAPVQVGRSWCMCNLMDDGDMHETAVAEWILQAAGTIAASN
jgi:hypothetical protein